MVTRAAKGERYITNCRFCRGAWLMRLNSTAQGAPIKVTLRERLKTGRQVRGTSCDFKAPLEMATPPPKRGQHPRNALRLGELAVLALAVGITSHLTQTGM